MAFMLIHKNFGGGWYTDISNMQAIFNMHTQEQLVHLCITGRKYLSGKDKQSATKCKTTDGTSQKAKRMQQEDDSDED